MLLALSTAARAQLSPGPLARAHRELEGALNCTKCHAARRAPMATACQSCHREIAWLVERQRGYHARETGAGRRDCAGCHPDHAGPDFALVSWPGGTPERFDHRQAGWALEGRHLDLRCQECHATAYRVSPAADLSRRREGAGWVGLEPTCGSCHRDDDAHRGALDAACDKCHDAGDWKRAPRFDHDQTDYVLTGRHTEVECDACHLAPRLPLRRDATGNRIPIYEPVPFRSCLDCHSDPHKGRLSSRCSECHSTRGFEEIDRRDFNHALTRYPLRGKHAGVSCAACHGENLARPNPPSATCAACHQDPHGGEATLAGDPADCGSCHRVEGFAPSTYGVMQHRSAAYPLDGKHTPVACTGCHVRRPVGGRTAPVARLRVPYRRCLDCHTDSHGGQLAARPGGGGCESCHAVAGWTPSTFTATSHATLRLRLEGRHAAIACAACHAAAPPGLPAATRREALGTAGVAVTLTRAECAACHVDAHRGRYATGGAVAIDGACAACHGTTSFRPSSIDMRGHDRFRFRLEGAHRAVACVACHRELQSAPATSTLLLAARGVTWFPATAPAVAATCAGCHEAPHGRQFAARRDRGACEGCHGVDAFTPASRFDHDRDAAFSLRGAHAKVACAACHRRDGPAANAPIVYRPLSGKCESCHDKAPRGGAS
jgi:hypothetical protein